MVDLKIVKKSYYISIIGNGSSNSNEEIRNEEQILVMENYAKTYFTCFTIISMFPGFTITINL